MKTKQKTKTGKVHFMTEKIRQISRISIRYKFQVMSVFMIVCLTLLGAVIFMLVKNFHDSQTILEDSIEDRMLSLALVARDQIDPEKFLRYTSAEAMEADPEFSKDLGTLRDLARRMGAQYMYAVRKFGDEYRFIYDTDEEDTTYFEVYEDIPEVHLAAFKGMNSATALEGDDEWGSYSTGSVPLFDRNQKIIGIVAADVDDAYIEHYRDVQFKNLVILLGIMVFTMLFLGFLLRLLLRNAKEMHDILYKQARYDKLTNLPNRQFLVEQLEKLTNAKKVKPFSLFFIDLDNFKSVNDTAGHDAGDELLKNIGNYLNTAHKNTRAFRPSPGMLNIAARIGGDEFILMAPDLKAEEAENFGKELIEGLQKISDINIKRFNVGFSIGIAMYPNDSINYHALIKYADIAMYHAKASGKNACLLYNVEMSAKIEK